MIKRSVYIYNTDLNTIYVRLSTRRFARRRRSTRLEFFVRTTGRADATYYMHIE